MAHQILQRNVCIATRASGGLLCWLWRLTCRTLDSGCAGTTNSSNGSFHAHCCEGIVSFVVFVLDTIALGLGIVNEIERTS